MDGTPIVTSDINLSAIVVNEAFWTRDMKDAAVDELAANIKSIGRIINPLLVRMIEESGKYELVCGNRRYRAAKLLKLQTVPCQVVDLTDVEAFAAAISEHVRKDPSPLEEGVAYARAVNEYDMDQKEIAKLAHVSPNTVTNRIKLTQLPGKIQVLLQEGKISVAHCEDAFFLLKHDADIKELYERIVRQISYQNPMSAKDAAQTARGFAASRLCIETWAEWVKTGKAKTVKCPDCGAKPDTDELQTNGTIECSDCSRKWNAFKSPESFKKPQRELNTDDDDDPEPIRKPVVPSPEESRGLESKLSPTDILEGLWDIVGSNELVTDISLAPESSWNGRTVKRSGYTLTVTFSQPPKGVKMPEVFQVCETEKHAPGARVDVGYPYYDRHHNKEILEQRELFWKFEKAQGATVQAEIARVVQDRIVINHKALRKGVELAVDREDDQVYVIQQVHRDWTAMVKNPKGDTVFMDRDELKDLVKRSK